MEENILIVFIIFVVLVMITGITWHLYKTSHMLGDAQRNNKLSEAQRVSRDNSDTHEIKRYAHDEPNTHRYNIVPANKPCDLHNLTELKSILRLALATLRQNTKFIKTENILSYRPEILLIKYPFYSNVLRLPKYLDENSCMTNEQIVQALKELYGDDLASVDSLHAYVPGYQRYYLMIDINDAIAYYNFYKNAGVSLLL